MRSEIQTLKNTQERLRSDHAQYVVDLQDRAEAER